MRIEKATWLGDPALIELARAQAGLLGITTVTINTVSPSGFGHVVIFERSARAVVARAPPEILDPSDFGSNTKSMGKWCVFMFSLLTSNLLRFSQRYYMIHV